MSNANSEVGSYSISSCTCNPGYQKYKNQSYCQQCTYGQYNAYQNSTCLACPENSYSDEMSSTLCQQCPTHSSYEHQGATSVWSCLCEAGSSAHSLTHCALCEAGKFKEAQGMYDCTACPENTFSAEGATTCTSCHEHSSTMQMTMQTEINACQIHIQCKSRLFAQCCYCRRT